MSLCPIWVKVRLRALDLVSAAEQRHPNSVGIPKSLWISALFNFKCFRCLLQFLFCVVKHVYFIIKSWNLTKTLAFEMTIYNKDIEKMCQLFIKTHRSASFATLDGLTSLSWQSCSRGSHCKWCSITAVPSPTRGAISYWDDAVNVSQVPFVGQIHRIRNAKCEKIMRTNK